ncbi:hypothetical protein MMC26_000841 [Xylographa opegraphella]|nr:hypothetical protein [Xylographa opegraphella]
MADEIDDLQLTFEALRDTEHAKNRLIEDLLGRLRRLCQELEQEKLDHDRESHFNREVQLRVKELKDELRLVKTRTERDAFILVLIDGDGMIFDDPLIQRGENGGREAAGILWGAVRDYVQQIMPDLTSDYKIVTRVYANLKGLGDVCTRAGILDSPTIMEDFTRGFTGSKQLFDFTDVGSGKDRADDKVSELFKLFVNNSHCKHIIFGGSHDNGYARLLEDIAGQATPNQITLLEGVPFERELAIMKSKYLFTRFDTLFRSTKINIYQQQYQQLQQIRPQPNSQSQSMSQMAPSYMSNLQSSHSSGLHNGVPDGLSTAFPVPQPQQTGYQSPYHTSMTRTPSESTNNSMMNPLAPTWANKVVSAPPAQTASPPPTPQPSTMENANKIPRNKFGQRIDPTIQYDKSEVRRVQKIHMCNVHFLRHDCPYGNDCTHDHFYKPSKNELLTLRVIARGTPCNFGSACDDIKCIYGHR